MPLQVVGDGLRRNGAPRDCLQSTYMGRRLRTRWHLHGAYDIPLIHREVIAYP